MEKIVYAGSFDPLTKGHWWVIEQALEISQQVLVFVAENNSKKNTFSAKERKEMIEAVALSKGVQDRVQVSIIYNEYVAIKAIKMGAKYMIRGIRNSADFDYEAVLQRANTDTLQGAKTMFVMPPRDLDSVSSSFVKSLVGPIGWHWQVKQFLPLPVYNEWLKRFIVNVSEEFVDTKSHKNWKVFMDEVIKNYSNEDRYYHNLEHIIHCIQELQWVKKHHELNVDYESIFIAILGHDLIYKANGEESDEVQSAKLTEKILGKGVKKSIDIILATQHTLDLKKNFSEDEKLMRSIDLAILAQPSGVYKEYVKNIRKEYIQYSNSDYIKGRIKVLEKFISASDIYEHEAYAHYKEDSYTNLKKELSSLNKQLQKEQKNG